MNLRPAPGKAVISMAGVIGSLWLVAAIVFAPAHAAAALVPVPPFLGLVTDLTSTLTAQQQAGLEVRLQAFEERKGSQLAVLVVETTQPEPIEQYALRVAEQWKVGRKKIDDGAILVVAKTDRTVRIEVGYGLEGVLPDISTKRIIDEVIVPRFKQGDYFGGIDSGLDQMIKLVDGEALPARAHHPDAQADLGRLVPLLLVIAVVVGGALRAALGRLPGAALTAGAAGLIVWFLAGTIAIAVFGALIAFVVTLIGGGAGLHGGWRGHGGGHYRSGGFGGGGFRGGGGGGFGGGGASGRW